MFDLIPNDKIMEIKELLNGGFTFREIKNKTGISLGTISKVKNGLIEPNRKESIFNDEEFSKLKLDNEFLKNENQRLELICDKNQETILKLKKELEQLRKQILNDPKPATNEIPKKSLKERLLLDNEEPISANEPSKMTLFEEINK